MTAKKVPAKKSVVKEAVAKVKKAVGDFLDPAPVVQLKPTTSSQIAAYGYDPATQTLAVQFIDGGLYYYKGVPLGVYTAMDSAKSVGSFVAKNVKGKFEFEKIDHPASELNGAALESMAVPEASAALDHIEPEPEFKSAIPEIEKAVKVGLVEEAPEQIAPAQADTLAENWASHDDWTPKVAATAPAIIEQAWNDIRGNDPLFHDCVRSFQDRLLASGLGVLGGRAPDFGDSPIARFEARVAELRSQLNTDEQAHLNSLPSNRIV